MRTILAIALCLSLSAGALAGDAVKGVSLAHLHRRGYGYGSEECRQELQRISALGANWVALNDFAYMPSVNSPVVSFNRDRSMSEADVRQTIRDAHAAGLKVLVKPHIWSREFWNNSKWHGDIAMSSEADWDAWFEQYGAYVLHHARIAQEEKADGLCLGVEYAGTVGQEARWRRLIAEVRKVYKGPLTYSAHWAEYDKIAWWDAVDVIGIGAYFPLAEVDNPSEQAVRQGWARVYADLEALHRRTGRPICFLELGYTPATKAAREPWAYDVPEENTALQAMLYRVAVEEAAKRDFVIGVFVWKWFTSDEWRRFERHEPFDMQDREPVLEVLRNAWKPAATANQAGR